MAFVQHMIGKHTLVQGVSNSTMWIGVPGIVC